MKASLATNLEVSLEASLAGQSNGRHIRAVD